MSVCECVCARERVSECESVSLSVRVFARVCARACV